MPPAYSPLGGAAALFSLFLPWVHLECGDTKVDPTLIQLAEEKGVLYFFVAMALVLLIVALGMVIHRRRGWALGTMLAGVLGTAGWIYLWFRKDDLAGQMASIEGLDGRLQAWMQQLTTDLAVGFYLYLAAMLLGLCGAILWLASPGETPDSTG